MSFLHAKNVIVPDHPENLGGISRSDEQARRAVPMIELLLDDREVWEVYAEIDRLAVAKIVYGKQLRNATKRR